MDNTVIMFRDIFLTSNSEIGGKARSLIKLSASGFNVPDGFIITAELQHIVFERHNIPELIQKEVPILLSDDFTKTSNAAKRIRDAILAINFTKQEIEYINTAVKELLNNNEKSTFAVRSSGDVEDGTSDSWAGQFDSFLDVRSDDVPTYIKHCWASMFGLRAIRYSSGILTNKKLPAFAVVVQIMVHGDYSGIAFSVDPADGDKNHVRIETVIGTGDKVVSGQETPYSVVLGREDGLILKRLFGSQGRIELVSPSILRELMETVLKIEKLFDVPIDVEWTILNNNIYILQARPITASQSTRKRSENEESLPDILDYELTFKVSGLGFMFADLLCHGFGYLHPLFICNHGEFLQYFTNERMEYAARYGHRWLSTPGGFDEYKQEFTKFHNASFSQMKSIISEDLTGEGIQQFFEVLYQYFIRYSKMDFQFTNLTFLYANENPVIAQSLKGIAEFKDVARVWVNAVSIDDDCLLNKLLVRISEQFNLTSHQLESYKISELVGLFNNRLVDIKEVELRSTSSIVMTDGRSIKYYVGDVANSFIDGVKSIRKSQALASIVGQVANRGTERYVDGIVKLINVDYGNLENMEKEMAEMRQGEILVSEFTSPELMLACKKAKVIVTDLGGMLSHAAIVSREFGIPCVVGTEHASHSLKNGDNVRVDLDLGIVEVIK
jgi:pyruvate,water dikinase